MNAGQSRFVRAICGGLLFLMVIGMGHNAHAQVTPPPPSSPPVTTGPRWCATLPYNVAQNCYRDAVSACYYSWLSWKNPATNDSKFFGVVGNNAACDWSEYDHLCPSGGIANGQLFGGILGCGGRIGVATLALTCDPTFEPVGNDCVSRFETIPAPKSPSGTCQIDTTDISSPGPIVYAIGAKRLSAIDYTSSDNRLTIARTYLSRNGQSGLWNGRALGIGDKWRLNFLPELHFENPITTGVFTAHFQEADGTNAIHFRDPATGLFSNTPSTSMTFVGTWPANNNLMFYQSATFQVTDRNDTVWTMVSVLNDDDTYRLASGRWGGSLQCRLDGRDHLGVLWLGRCRER
jgi:hypothetical protein